MTEHVTKEIFFEKVFNWENNQNWKLDVLSYGFCCLLLFPSYNLNFASNIYYGLKRLSFKARFMILILAI